eukprot:2633070-Rhodomonas_salina.1
MAGTGRRIGDAYPPALARDRRVGVGGTWELMALRNDMLYTEDRSEAYAWCCTHARLTVSCGGRVVSTAAHPTRPPTLTARLTLSLPRPRRQASPLACPSGREHSLRRRASPHSSQQKKSKTKNKNNGRSARRTKKATDGRGGCGWLGVDLVLADKEAAGLGADSRVELHDAGCLLVLVLRLVLVLQLVVLLLHVAVQLLCLRSEVLVLLHQHRDLLHAQLPVLVDVELVDQLIHEVGDLVAGEGGEVEGGEPVHKLLPRHVAVAVDVEALEELGHAVPVLVRPVNDVVDLGLPDLGGERHAVALAHTREALRGNGGEHVDEELGAGEEDSEEERH